MEAVDPPSLLQGMQGVVGVEEALIVSLHSRRAVRRAQERLARQVGVRKPWLYLCTAVERYEEQRSGR